VIVYAVAVAAVIGLPIWVLREMRRGREQLDRIERRLEELDRRAGPDPR
jgi:ribose 1,5-bisphosphokinase PhnN